MTCVSISYCILYTFPLSRHLVLFWMILMCCTYNHANADLLATFLLLYGVVENNVQEDLKIVSILLQFGSCRGVESWRRRTRGVSRTGTNIISTKNTNNLAAAVQLNEQSLVEILYHPLASLPLYDLSRAAVLQGTFALCAL